MKVRYGFVANSSSSSFVVAVKEGVDVRAAILGALGVPKDARLYPFAETIADYVKDNLDDAPEYWLEKDRWGEGPDEEKVALRAAGYTLYELCVANDEGPLSNMLYENMGMIAMDTDAIKVIP